MPDGPDRGSTSGERKRIPDLQIHDVFTVGNSATLAEHIGVNTQYKRLELAFSLNRAAESWQVYLHTEAYDTQPESLKDLDCIREKALSLLEKMDRLDPVTRAALAKGLSAYRHHYEPFPTEMLRLLNSYVYWLAEAALVFGDPRFKPSRADNVHDLRVLCMELAKIYEIYSRRRFTYNYHKGEFITHGSWWVAEAARIVAPELSSENLATAMREIPRRIKRLQDTSR